MSTYLACFIVCDFQNISKGTPNGIMVRDCSCYMMFAFNCQIPVRIEFIKVELLLFLGFSVKMFKILSLHFKSGLSLPNMPMCKICCDIFFKQG